MNPSKAALLINGKLEGAGQSAIYRAQMGAQDLRRAGDDVVIVFDGAGSTAAADMAQSGHRFHALFADVLPAVRGVRPFCAKRYGVFDALQAAELPLLESDRGNASQCGLMLEDSQVITFWEPGWTRPAIGLAGPIAFARLDGACVNVGRRRASSSTVCRTQAGTRTSRMSTSRSTYAHSGELRRASSSSSNAGSCSGA